MRKGVKQQNKHLFTPTTVIKIQNQNKSYPVVIHKAYMNTSGHVVFTASTKEINSSKKLIKIPCGKFNNVRLDIDAPNRSGGIVYHVSDCGYPNVRSYAFGGAGPGSACGTQLLLNEYLDIMWTKCPDAYNEKGNPPYDFNWTLADFWIINYKTNCQVL